MKRVLAIFLALCTLSQVLSASDKLGLRTLVIDAGHGGKDPGAVNGKYYEKTFTLDIAQQLRDKVKAAYPDVKVVMTRDDDTFISLNKRAEIANKANADLFMSIHINSSAESAANGYSVHVLGKSHKANTDIFRLNLDMVKRENSVITLDDDYNPETAGFDPTNPESYIFMTMMQSAYLEKSIQYAQDIMTQLEKGPFTKNRGVSQDPFYVLWKTSMPSVLVELGFISNSDDLAALRDEAKKKQIADELFDAFVKYKTEYDASMSISSAPVSTPAPSTAKKAEVKPQQTEAKEAPKAVVEKQKKEMYGVQIFTVGTEVQEGDSRLLGYKPLIIKSGSKFRHIICLSDTREEALEKRKSIVEKYPDSYIVKVEVDR